MKHFTLIFMVCLLGGMLTAGTSTASICDSKDTVVFFGNGVKTVEKKAFESLKKVELRLQRKVSSEEFDVLEFDLAYNDTHGLPLDLMEAAAQILTGNMSRFWRLLWGHEFLPDWFVDKVLLLSTGLDKTTLLTTDSLKDHVATYEAKAREGKRIILVAHSQGNLFGNLAHSLLSYRAKQSFSMVSVANVDNNVLGSDTPYTTLGSDKVVAALILAQAALPSRPLPPNTENAAEPGDILSHYFVKSYMAEGSNSEAMIMEQILASLSSAPFPPQYDKPGIITVTLTWTSEPDMDLHVYEPNGMQVYWENRYGLSGELDDDDRCCLGPEHYTVPTCETLERGIYHVALDYFKGDGPETGTVRIEAGLLVRTYEVYMPSELYGNVDSPELVANIWVKGGENGGIDFEIYE